MEHAATAHATGRRLVAAIGINGYQRWPRLDNAVHDARAALAAFERLGFERAAEPLYDEAATADAIRRLVTDQLSRLHKNDSLVVFFAGHGHTTTQTFHDGESIKTGYVIPVDGDPPEVSGARWLRLDSWLSDIARLPVKHLLVFLDACHSGIALGALIKWRGPQQDSGALECLARRRSRKVITSALDDQRAMDGGTQSGHSLFTQCLLDGLDGGIAPPGTLVTGSQIGLYLQQRVASFPGSGQTPDFGALEQDRRGEFVIPLAARPDRDVSSEAPSQRFRRSLAVVIGIDRYGEGISPLRSAVADATAVAQALERGGFETWPVLGADASLHRLLAVLRQELPQALGPDDRLVFYFAGRGVASDGDRAPTGYLVPADARRADRGGFLALDVLYGELAKLPVRHAFLVLDCCFSGLRQPSRAVAPALAMRYREHYDRYLACAAWQVLASVTDDRFALDLFAIDRGEGRGAHSPFARALLDGLAGGADRMHRALITADDLAAYVRDRSAPGAATPLAQQFVLGRHAEGQFVFEVPGRDVALQPAPPLDPDDDPYRGVHGAGADGAPVPWWQPRRLAVPAIPRDRLRELIEQPTCAAALHFDPPALIERLLDDAAPLASPLPSLAFALGALFRACCARWRAGDRSRALLATDYDAIGGLAEAMTRRAAALCDELVAADAAHARTIRSLFLRLVAARVGAAGRSRIALDELVFDEPDENRRVACVVERFETAGLLARAARPRDDQVSPEVELVDDALLADGGPVSPWIRELHAQTGTLALLAALFDAVRSWRAGGRTEADLWPSSRAALAAPLERAHRLVLSVDETQFLQRSASRARRRRAVLVDRVRSDRHLLARSYQETGRQLLIDGRPLEALPCLLEARCAGAAGPVLRMLFAAARAASPAPTMLQHDGTVESAAFSADGARVITASSDHHARIWDAVGGAQLPPRLEHRDAVLSAAFSPDGTRVVTTGSDRTARLWNAATGAPLARPLAHHSDVHGARFSPDGRLVVTVCDRIAQVWDIATGEPVSPALEHDGFVWSAVFSPDGRCVVTACTDQTVRIWEPTTGARLGAPLEHPCAVRTAVVSADSARIVTSSRDKTARLWHTTSGASQPLLLEHHHMVWCAVFSPDGTRVATASSDHSARIWDAATGQPVARPLGHRDKVLSVAFSADGTRVVTASSDRTARIWDAVTGGALGPPLEHRGEVSSAAFSPDGARIVTTVSDDRAAWLWTIPLDHGTLAEWRDVVQRGPYQLSNGILSLR